MRILLEACDKYAERREWGSPDFLLFARLEEQALLVGVFENNPLPQSVDAQRFVGALADGLNNGDVNFEKTFGTIMSDIYCIGVVQEGLLLDATEEFANQTVTESSRLFTVLDIYGNAYIVTQRHSGVPIPLHVGEPTAEYFEPLRRLLMALKAAQHPPEVDTIERLRLLSIPDEA